MTILTQFVGLNLVAKSVEVRERVILKRTRASHVFYVKKLSVERGTTIDPTCSNLIYSAR